MLEFKKIVAAAMLSLTFMGSTAAFAQDIPEDSPLADGKISEDELAVILATAQKQMIRLSDAASDEYRSELLDDKPNMPAAWMLMKDGETVKRINIDSQVGEVPATTRLVMYRAAIKSIARRGEVNAAAILYTGRVSEDSDTEALVIEHERRLGVSAHKVIGYELEGNEISWAEPVTRKKPFEWFYGDKKSDS